MRKYVDYEKRKKYKVYQKVDNNKWEYMGHYSNYGVIANDLNISTIVVKKLIDGIPNYLEDKYRIVFQMN